MENSVIFIFISGCRNTEPFQLTEVNGQLFGRGSTDDKGPALGWLNVIEAMQTLGIEMPVNVKVRTGPGIAAFVSAHSAIHCLFLPVLLRGNGGERIHWLG
jgi:hypothetical protein